ncbi:MAG: outer membrane lipoprotein carrier protein LolA [Spirochaetes bacterium]|nr:outer membrane lipoprotein carrier protein LolA [Spirochaetota bacterium]
MVKRVFSLFFITAVLGLSSLTAQEIITAERFLEMVSERYGAISDYEADVVIRSGNTDMVGRLSYLSPNLLRIDFSRPAQQVIVFSGDTLTVHLPEFRATLTQSISQSNRNPAAGIGMVSPQGLTLLRRNYIATFVTGPNPVPLYPGSSEQVVQLRLTRRVISEGFREIILSIDNETRLIRRIEGRTVAEGIVRFDFTNVRTNVGIPEQRFVYVPPPTANVISNFLFRDVD